MVDSTQIENNIGLVKKVINDLDFIPEGIEYEDLVQIGEIALWQAYEQTEEQDAVSTYYYNVIRNTIINHLRKATSKKRKKIYMNDIVVDTEKTAMSDLLIYEISKLLPSLEFNIFTDKYIEDMTLEELAKKYKLSIKQIRNRLSHSKDKLQNNLKWED